MIALDLEGTLISNALSQFPRPGLHAFLEGANAGYRVVIYTAISEARFRPIAQRLVDEGHAPSWFRTVEFTHWSGPYKDLAFVPEAEISQIRLFDDLEAYVHPEQRAQWVPVAPFESPYPEEDRELFRLAALIAR